MQPVKNLFFATLSAAVIFSACKKNDELVSSTPLAPTTTPATNSTSTAPSASALRDSAVAIARDIYLWNDQIPNSFSTSGMSDYNSIMTAIRAFSNESGFSAPVDKWSFAMKKNEWDQMSGGIGSTFSSTSANGDFGMQVFFKSEGDLRVRLVEPNAPAGIAGVKRGWRITQINGNSNITTGNASFIVDAIYNGTSSSVTFQKPDGSTATLSLTAAHYQEKPVYLDTVYAEGSHRIGYLVFNSFLGSTSQIQSEFSRVFGKFSSAGITDLIVDLRYNGGGYVSLAENLANYIANSAANGQVMMRQVFNNQNTQNNTTTVFHKTGNINLGTVYFIVGRGTASASELLINSLRPVMNVKMLGASRTHGKPVGFFPIPLADWYLFPVSFKTTNKNGEGNYYNGLPVDAQVADGLDVDWGNMNEASLASAINHITSGSFFRTAPYSEPLTVSNGNSELESRMIKVTVDDRY